MEYVTYGFGAFKGRYKELETTSFDEAASLSQQGRALASVIALTRTLKGAPDEGHRQNAINQTLDVMENTVKLFAAGAGELQLQTNYMLKLTREDLGARKPRFMQKDIGEYGYFLSLVRYRSGRTPDVTLPVDADALSASLLPGAPSCAAQFKAECLNTRKIAYRSGVTANVKKEIDRFFADAPFASVLSVPLFVGTTLVGVANVESNLVGIVGKGDDMISKIGDALSPCSLVLAELVGAPGDQ